MNLQSQSIPIETIEKKYENFLEEQKPQNKNEDTMENRNTLRNDIVKEEKNIDIINENIINNNEVNKNIKMNNEFNNEKNHTGEDLKIVLCDKKEDKENEKDENNRENLLTKIERDKKKKKRLNIKKIIDIPDYLDEPIDVHEELNKIREKNKNTTFKRKEKYKKEDGKCNNNCIIFLIRNL